MCSENHESVGSASLTFIIASNGDVNLVGVNYFFALHNLQGKEGSLFHADASSLQARRYYRLNFASDAAIFEARNARDATLACIFEGLCQLYLSNWLRRALDSLDWLFRFD